MPDDVVPFEIMCRPDYASALGKAHDAAERHNRGWGSRQQSVHSLTLDAGAAYGELADAANTFEACGDPSSASELLAKADDMAGVALAVSTRMRKVLVTGGPV